MRILAEEFLLQAFTYKVTVNWVWHSKALADKLPMSGFYRKTSIHGC